jgi:hypothetical protein
VKVKAQRELQEGEVQRRPQQELKIHRKILLKIPLRILLGILQMITIKIHPMILLKIHLMILLKIHRSPWRIRRFML